VKQVRKRIAGGWLFAGRFIPRFFADAGAMTKAILESVVLIVVIIMLDTYVIGNNSIINSQNSIGKVVVPILQAALLIAAILGAIAVIYFAATHSLGKSK
jgi:hypothetical protein